MQQEKFAQLLTEGEIPDRWDQPYTEFFGKVKRDHLIGLEFSCGCVRFIEVKVYYMGPNFARDEEGYLRGGKYQFKWTYHFPDSQIDCGMVIADKYWPARMPVFRMRNIPYKHGYFDHHFREFARKQAQRTEEKPMVYLS